MRLRAINSDGSPAPDAEFDLPIVSEDGSETDIVIRCRVLTPDDIKACQKKATTWKKNPVTRGMFQHLDDQLSGAYALEAAIVSWVGIEGRDGQPLVCNDTTKHYLPSWVKMQVAEACTQTEVSEQEEATFRESQGVVRVVGGSG